MTDWNPYDNHDTDATHWASECAKIIYSSYTSDPEFDLEELLLTWFANAIEIAKDSLTVAQLAHQAANAASFRALLYNTAEREFAIAKTKFEEGQMWFTRGMAIHKGVFNPADLEADNE